MQRPLPWRFIRRAAAPRPSWGRCSSGGGGGSNNGMALACRDRAASNVFYFVPYCLDVDALRSRAGALADSPRPHGAALPSQPPNC
mmetsp:Transcript_49050/g.104310  ORF Transcript_49050/g.104310 Transcript_49050/m.104310 type:complete len:86 (-) Transcript_49050:261-518(-)